MLSRPGVFFYPDTWNVFYPMSVSTNGHTSGKWRRVGSRIEIELTGVCEQNPFYVQLPKGFKIK